MISRTVTPIVKAGCVSVKNEKKHIKEDESTPNAPTHMRTGPSTSSSGAVRLEYLSVAEGKRIKLCLNASRYAEKPGSEALSYTSLMVEARSLMK